MGSNASGQTLFFNLIPLAVEKYFLAKLRRLVELFLQDRKILHNMVINGHVNEKVQISETRIRRKGDKGRSTRLSFSKIQ